MIKHSPSTISGPVSRTRKQWKSHQPKAPRKRRSESAPIRQDLVDRVRKEIAAGTYDTPEKFDKALNIMLGDLDLA